MYAKKSGRISFKSNRRQGYRRNNFSNGKMRNKGNLPQQYQKYLKLAKEASSSGDRIQTEYYYQFADHYSRLMVELGISIEDNNEDITPTPDTTKETKKLNEDNNSENDTEIINKKNESTADPKEFETDHESIESVSFLSSSAKKKPVKSKKT